MVNMSVNEKMTALADAIREKSGVTVKLTIDGMTSAVKAISSLIVASASGNPIVLNDSTDLRVQSLRLFGKTTQDGTPTPEAPVPLVSAGDGGSVGVMVAGKNLFDITAMQKGRVDNGVIGYADGTSELNVYDNTVQFTTIAAWRGICSGYIPVIAGAQYALDFTDNSSNYCTLTANYYDINRQFIQAIKLGDTTMNTLAPFVAHEKAHYMILAVMAEYVGDYMLSDITLEFGSTATAYEPYKPVQTLPVSTPNGLPGIPVTSGGNYTDETGQQWLCDEVDFTRGVYVQRIGKTVFDGSSDEPWNTGGTNQSGVYRMRCNPSFFGNAVKPAEKNNAVANVMSSGFVGITAEQTYKGQIGIGVDTVGEVWLYDSRYSTGNKTAFLNYLAENPMQFIYELATPIVTPLSAEELAAYAALHTNYPNTTILNDGGAGMEVQYVADTKLYIDNKINAMAAAIVNA